MAKNNKAEEVLVGGTFEIGELPPGRIEELPVVDVTLQYETLLNYLKPLLSHDALVLLAEKKKEIFG